MTLLLLLLVNAGIPLFYERRLKKDLSKAKQ